MLFRFRLRPVADVMAWGDAENQHLHWFGLTDGWYWLDAGGSELFRYDAALVDHIILLVGRQSRL